MSRTLDSTPRADGFSMPAEWAPHRRCWMAWPERPDYWRLGAKPAQSAFTEVASLIAGFEPVSVCVSAAQYAHARASLPPAVRLLEMSHDDAWLRDIGPSFVRHADGRVRAVDWRFNAWGGLLGGVYFPWDKDDALARKIAEVEEVDDYRAPLVMEGGAFHVDGEGTVLTTEQCLLNPNRNPELSKSRIEALLCDYLGAGRVIWLGEGLANDETDGHVDNLCCFLRPGVVALCWTDDPADPQYACCHDALERLRAARDARGRALEVVKLPLPGQPLFMTAEEVAEVDRVPGTAPRVAAERLAASYVNFYLGNGVVVMPAFGDAADTEARDILARAFRDRQVRQVHQSREILLGGGNIHCITQQQPLGR